MNRTYKGSREAGHALVTVHWDDDGHAASAVLPTCQEIANHGPGFEWGYLGSGPAQLALAVTVDHARHHPADLALLRRIAGIAWPCDLCGAGGPDCATCKNEREVPCACEGGCDVCGGDGTAPCPACNKDAQLLPHQGCDCSLEALCRVAHQLVKERLIATMPRDSVEWSFGSPMVHHALEEIAAVQERRRTDAGS